MQKRWWRHHQFTTNSTTSATNNSSNETTSTNTATTRSNDTYIYGIGIFAVLAIGVCVFFVYNTFQRKNKKIVNEEQDIIIIIISFILIRKRYFLSHIYRNRLFRNLKVSMQDDCR